MKLIEYFGASFLTVIFFVVLGYVPLVQDFITKSGYTSSEVLGGFATIFIILYTFILAYTGGR